MKVVRKRGRFEVGNFELIVGFSKVINNKLE